MHLSRHKKLFLLSELGLLTINAAFSTRNKGSPIYSKRCSNDQRVDFRRKMRAELLVTKRAYARGRVKAEMHCDYIESLANRVTQSHGAILYGRRLRFGVAQKLVNLHLKYLWVAGLIGEPPHCPIDGIVRDLAGIDYDWTTSDSRPEYERAVAALRRFSEPRTPVAWELQEFRRRAQRRRRIS